MAKGKNDADLWDEDPYDGDIVSERMERDGILNEDERDEEEVPREPEEFQDLDPDDLQTSRQEYEGKQYSDDRYQDGRRDEAPRRRTTTDAEEEAFRAGYEVGYQQARDSESYERQQRHEEEQRSARREKARQDRYDDAYRGRYQSDWSRKEDDTDPRRGNSKDSRKESGKEKKEREKRQMADAKRRGKDDKKRREKKHHPVRNFFLILLLIILCLLAFVFYRIHTMQSKAYTDSDISDSISDSVKTSTESGTMSNYLNIAILGLDSVEGSLDAGNNRSDVMIIASINETTGEIKLVSLYRDTFVDIGDGNYQKANAAYAFGGPQQTLEMMNRNLDLNITDYAAVGFEGIARIIDAVGGVEIDVQEDEIEHLNNYQLTMSQETGMEDIPVTQPGLQTLNGLQATAYCRIRYTDGGDFKRTERQRTVLTKTLEKIKSNPVNVIRSANTLMSYVKTSLSMSEILALGLQAYRYSITDTQGFPNSDLYAFETINQQSCVVPVTLAKNVTWLHEQLFGESDYTPSETVQSISSTISQISGY